MLISFPVLEKDVERVIKDFSINKAPGYDRFSARVFKYSLPVILPSITSVIYIHTSCITYSTFLVREAKLVNLLSVISGLSYLIYSAKLKSEIIIPILRALKNELKDFLFFLSN